MYSINLFEPYIFIPANIDKDKIDKYNKSSDYYNNICYKANSEYGTDIYILGFKYANSSDWKHDIVVSLLDGFLYAIMEKHLSVSIGDISVNNKTVDKLIEQYNDQLDPRTVDYYKLLTLSEEDGVATRSLSYLENEDILVKMMVKPGLHKRVGIIRHPGMKVFDKGYISSTVSFAGICIIKGKQYIIVNHS